MDSNETYYTELITRYLAGEATPEEIAGISAWIQQAPENKALFREMHQTWLLMVRQEVEDQVEMKEEWTNLQKRTGGVVKPGKPEPFIPRSKSPNPLIDNLRQPHSGSRLSTTDNAKTFPPQKREHLQPLRDIPEPVEPEVPVVDLEEKRTDWRIYAIRFATIAAIILVLLIPTWMVIQYILQEDVNRIAASDQVLETTLPDGTRVTLNAFSSLIVPEEFGRTSREIALLGQGYFEVFYDPGLPFIITIGDARIEVKGTSFYVDAPNPESNVSVVLVEGSVALYFAQNTQPPKTMIPGERAEMNRSENKITIIQNDDPNFLAWKTQRIIFFDDSLDKIISTLNKVYQSNISLGSDELATCRMTATFNRQPLESVLKVLEATLDLRFEQTNDGSIILYGDGCR